MKMRFILFLLVLSCCQTGDRAAESDIFFKRGQAFKKAELWPEAIKEYSKSIQLDSSQIFSYLGRADAYMAIGELDSACQDWSTLALITDSIWGFTEYRKYCQADTQPKWLPDTSLLKAPVVSSESSTLIGKIERSLVLLPSKDFDTSSVSFLYIYRQDKPEGKNVSVAFDKFFKKYTISYVNPRGQPVVIKLTDDNFIGTWEFNYKGFRYFLSNVLFEEG